jgi:hypothetical protein
VNFFRRKSAIVAVLLAWLCATGVQWDLLQACAWARMFADNARRLPLLKAVDRTFSPEGRCEFCEVVTTAKRQADTAAVTTEKFGATVKLLPAGSRGVIIVAPSFAPWSVTEFTCSGTGRSPPPLPPPRA